MNEIFRNDLIFVEIHPSPLPWLKLFSATPYKELSQAPREVREILMDTLLLIEREMITYFNPTKINIASFGNYLPHLHIHITARFANDSHFPESMWGTKQRENGYAPTQDSLQEFYTLLTTKLSKI